MTLSENYLDTPFRLMDSLYDMVEFDCSSHKDCKEEYVEHCNMAGRQCMARSEKIREDMFPFLQSLMYKNLRTAKQKYEGPKNEDIDWNQFDAKELCKEDTPDDLMVLLNLASILQKMNMTHDQELEWKTVNVLAKIFRASKSNFTGTLIEYIHKLKPEHQLFLSSDSFCYEQVDTLPMSDLKLFQIVMDASGLNQAGPISFGQILTEIAMEYLSGTSIDQSVVPQSVQDSVFKEINDIYSNLWPDVAYPPICLYYFFAGYRYDIFCKSEKDQEKAGLCTYCRDKEISLPRIPIQAILKYLKYSIPPMTHKPHLKSEMVETNDIIKRKISNSYSLKHTFPQYDVSRFLKCKYIDEKYYSGCNLFSNIFTTTGIGHVFNNIPFWSMFKNTTENVAFYDQLYEIPVSFEHKLPRMIEANGRDFSLEFDIVHGNRRYFGPEMKSYQGDELQMAIHAPGEIPNILFDGMVIKPGLSYEISVSPTLTITDKSALNLAASQRKCFSKHENQDLSVFKTYSQTSCIFECRLRRASRLCNCTLWDYPKVDDSIDTCVDKYAYLEGSLDLSPTACFYKAMKLPVRPTDCHCPADCDHVQYSFDSQVLAMKLYK